MPNKQSKNNISDAKIKYILVVYFQTRYRKCFGKMQTFILSYLTLKDMVSQNNMKKILVNLTWDELQLLFRNITIMEQDAYKDEFFDKNDN